MMSEILRDLLREARDTVSAVIGEEGISDDRRLYRRQLAARLALALRDRARWYSGDEVADAQVRAHGDGQEYTLREVAKMLDCEPNIHAVTATIRNREQWTRDREQELAHVHAVDLPDAHERREAAEKEAA